MLNVVALMGRLTADPELRTTPRRGERHILYHRR